MDESMDKEQEVGSQFEPVLGHVFLNWIAPYVGLDGKALRSIVIRADLEGATIIEPVYLLEAEADSEILSPDPGKQTSEDEDVA